LAGTQIAVNLDMRTFIVLSSICLLVPPLPARAGFVPVLPGSIERVVAAGDRVAVLRGGTVFILHEDGTLLGRLAKPVDDEKPAGAPSSKQEVEHLLDTLDVAEIDRDTDYTDDLLDNEQRPAQRRRTRLGTFQAPVSSEAPAALAPALAASATDIWITTHRRIFHVGADGIPVRVSGYEGWGAPLAAGGQHVLAARGDSLALLTTLTGPRRLIQIPAPAHKVALSASGQRQAWATSSGIAWTTGSSRPQGFDPAASVADLTYCGESLVVLLADSVLVVPPDGPPETRTDDIQAHRLICPENMPWLAVGQRLLASADQGRHWNPIAAPAGVGLVDVAASTHHVWLATRDGLYASADGQAHVARSARSRVHEGRVATAWLSWMPKISVRAAAAVAPGRHQLEALAFAAFPLNGRSIPFAATAHPEEAGSEPEIAPTPSRHAERTADLRDPDESCLPYARRKAVELAMSEPERARSYVTRSGHAAWLPELRVLVSRRYGRSESLDVNSSSTALTSPLGIDTVNDIRYEARATWDLGKLVFSAEELAAQTQAMHMAELRRDIEATMNRLYFERRGLLLDVSSGGRGEGVRRHLRASEIDAELNAMSAGTFATCLSGKSAGE
jgi:hypothetical protein